MPFESALLFHVKHPMEKSKSQKGLVFVFAERLVLRKGRKMATCGSIETLLRTVAPLPLNFLRISSCHSGKPSPSPSLIL